MRKYKAGIFEYIEEEIYYTDDFITFYDENDEVLSEENLKYWSEWINSPWSQDHEKYEIRINCKDAYTPMDESKLGWVCEYYIIGYDGITASVFGYGNTEIEALKSCKEHFGWLQAKYNGDNKSF